MKWKKFELIIDGDDPVIRATIVEDGSLFSGDKTVLRDVCKSKHYENQGWWVFMDDNSLTHNFESIETFYRSGLKTYNINGY